MIIALVGGIGSGKTISAVREIVKNNYYPVTNFRLKHKNYLRLKYDNLIKEYIKKDGKKEKKVQKVNWEFWENLKNKHKNFSIFLDEAHNIINSRSSMKKQNILLSKWISQIRKILQDNPTNHIYIITQTPRQIDVNFRELTQVVIHCRKVEIGDKIYILQHYYNGFMNFEYGNCILKRGFVANPYFKFYQSYNLVKFSDGEEFI